MIREGTILCSDGARCYPKLCRTRKIKHFCCSHRQSQFNVKKKWQGKTIDVHTGTIDNVWRLIKGSLPKTLHTKSATNPTLLNGKIWTHVRAWQWRWENSSHKNLSSLHKLSRPLREEKTSAPLGFLTFPLKSTRVLFKEIALSGKCKNTVICGKKSMTKNANVENVGSINNPPGCMTARLHLLASDVICQVI